MKKGYKVTYYTGYIENFDRTIIFKRTKDTAKDRIISEEIVGWYFGEPNAELTETYKKGSLKAVFAKV